MEDFLPYSRWLHQHDNDIRQEFPDRPTEALAGEMDVNYYTVSRRATRMGVGKSAAFMHTSWKKGAEKKGGWKKARMRSKLSEAADQYMKEHFADTRNEDLARHFGVDVKTVRRWARRLGLTKNKEFMRTVCGSGRRGKSFYTPEQIAWRNRRIAEVYPDADEEGLQRLANELGVGVDYIGTLANRIGVVRRKYPPQLHADLADYFPTHTDKECAERFGMKKATIQGIARRHGWKKTRSHLNKIHDSNITAAREGQRMKRKQKQNNIK